MDSQAAAFRFEEWVCYVFDNPPDYRWFDLLADWGPCPPELLISYLTRLFEHAGDVLGRFSNAQLNQSFWFLLGADADAMRVLSDERVPWQERRRCLRSIFTLFEQCFAPRCGPFLSHLDERFDNPLNSVCYMWWDLFMPGRPANDQRSAELNAEVLGVMERILVLESDACRESALHGLGHWRDADLPRVTTVIDTFLSSHAQLRPELRRYALNARSGCIQ